MRLTTYFFTFLTGCLLPVSAAAFTVGEMARPTFSTAPAGNVRPTTAATGASRPTTAATGNTRPTTQPGNSGNRFTPETGETHPTTPAGLSAQRFTPSTGPVRPGLDAAGGRAEAFSLAPRPTKGASKQEVTVKQAAPAANPGLKAAKLGGGAGGMGGMTAQQQKERDRAAANSDAAEKLAGAKNYKATEEKAMSNIKGILNAVNGKNSKINEKASSARKHR